MKVLIFNYEYPPLGGGAGNVSFYHLREFASVPDLKIDFVTSSIGDKYTTEKVGENITIHYLPIGKGGANLHFQSQKDLIVYLWKAYFFSRKLVKEDKYDLTHSFFTVPSGFISLLLKWEFKLPYIISLQGSDVPGYSERFKFIYPFITPVIKFIWHRAEEVIACSGGLGDIAIAADPKQPIGVIPNGIDLDQFSLASSEKKSGEFKIINIGRLTQRKGLKYLIEAMAQLSKKYSNIKLQIIGEGDEMENLKDLTRELQIEDAVEFKGLIKHDDLPPYFSSADVFVLPSLNEGMPLVMLEAIASGLPVMATDIGGTKELVMDGVNGYVLKLKDSNDIVEKISTLVENPELRDKMAGESRKHAQSFGWDKIANMYVETYKRVNQNKQ